MELTAPVVEFRISMTPRIRLRVLVRTSCLPALRSVAFTLAIWPAGMLATPEANKRGRCALSAGSSIDRNVRADTKTLTATLQDVPATALHLMGTRQADPVQPNCGF